MSSSFIHTYVVKVLPISGAVSATAAGSVARPAGDPEPGRASPGHPAATTFR